MKKLEQVQQRFPVSSAACKELGNNYSLLTTDPETEETAKQIQAVPAYLRRDSEEEIILGTTAGQLHLSCNWRITGGLVLTALRVKKLQRDPVAGPPILFY